MKKLEVGFLYAFVKGSKWNNVLIMYMYEFKYKIAKFTFDDDKELYWLE